MSDRLKGKRAVVTAAAAGIGRACAIAFAREGATVIATDINESGIATLGKEGVAETARLDVRSTAEVDAFAKRIGKIDILLNAAGFVHHGTILDCSEEDWDFSFDLNVKSMHRTIKAFLPAMLAGGGGSIVNISSCAALRPPANRYVYSASKAAVSLLTRAVALDFITQGIRCNSICPGTVETPSMLDRAAAVGPDGRRDVRRPPEDGPAGHRRGNRRHGGLSCERRKRVHHRRRPRRRWRLHALTSTQSKASRMNKIDLNGRCAVVTGGAQGFGRAIAERFVASGAKVAIWDHDLPFAEKTAKEIGAAVSAFKVDVSDLAAVEKTRDATLKAFGKIDILVNNAGIAGVNKTVWETDLDEWRKVLRINLDGPFICCKAVVPAMLAQKYGRIVNIASIAGKEGNPNAAHYSASKAGLIALTKSLGKELAAARHPRQRGDAGGGEDRDLRPADAAAHRLHAVEDSEGAFRAGRGTRGDGRLAGVGGLRVLDRRGVRHFRRPGDILGIDRAEKSVGIARRRRACWMRTGAVVRLSLQIDKRLRRS